MKYLSGKAVQCLLLTLFLLFTGNLAVQAVSPAQLGLGLTDVAALDPSIIRDIKYATADNFTGQVLYPSDRCLLREPVAMRLLQAQRNLRSQGLGLKVFDCYRPIEVQRKMWSIYPDADYVANPAFPAPAIIVAHRLMSAWWTQVGRELPMPSRSSMNFLNNPTSIIWGRRRKSCVIAVKFCRNAMQQVGFFTVTTEWWHFDCAGLA